MLDLVSVYFLARDVPFELSEPCAYVLTFLLDPDQGRGKPHYLTSHVAGADRRARRVPLWLNLLVTM